MARHGGERHAGLNDTETQIAQKRRAQRASTLTHPSKSASLTKRLWESLFTRMVGVRSFRESDAAAAMDLDVGMAAGMVLCVR